MPTGEAVPGAVARNAMVSGRWRLGLALAFSTAAFWGLLPIALKKLLEYADPVTITWYRLSFSAAATAAYLLAARGFPRPRDLVPRMPALLVVAAAGLCLNYILYIAGLNRVSPGTAQVVIQLAPILMLLGGIALFRERFALPQWAGLLVFAFGLALFFNRRLHELLFTLSSYKVGVALVVAAAVAWAAYSLAQKKLHESWSPSAVLLSVYAAGSVAFLPWADPSAIFRMPPLGLALLAFAALNTVGAYACFAESLKHWEATRVSAILTTVPVLTLGCAAAGSVAVPWMVAPEDIGPIGYVGAALVVSGSLLAALWKRSARKIESSSRA